MTMEIPKMMVGLEDTMQLISPPPPLTSFPTLQLHSHIATADSMNNEVIGRAL